MNLRKIYLFFVGIENIMSKDMCLYCLYICLSFDSHQSPFTSFLFFVVATT